MTYEQYQKIYFGRLEDLTPEQLARKFKKSEQRSKLWQKPEYREIMLKKQRACGLRNYPSNN